MAGHAKQKNPLFRSKVVEISKSDDKYQLMFGGKPYFIKGGAVTGVEYLEKIKEFGGNSVRTYNTKDAFEILDSAQKLGLTVMLGLELGSAKKDFDPSDSDLVDSLKNVVRSEVLKYKDHPALLFWGLGNEVELFIGNGIAQLERHIQLWKLMNDLAFLIHELDPLHPVSTAIPRRSVRRQWLINRFCPELDIITFNSLDSFDKNELPFFTRKPYLISELGGLGFWQSKRTEWFSCIEATSQEKIKFINHQYEVFKNSNSFGSYAFYWGQKNEYSHTWFSLFTEKGETTEVAYNFKKLWSEKVDLIDRVKLGEIKVSGKRGIENIYLKCNQTYEFSFPIKKANPSKVELRWELVRDDVDYLNTSYITKKLEVIYRDSIQLNNFDSLLKTDEGSNSVFRYCGQLKTPKEGGAYRLFVFLKDEDELVSTSNICFFVRS
ncbi:MAG: hypothetical protein EOO43_01685 [Flavobacterium sp.]|nr:MAG: hypothetical protein EOO43_01685 [Flavobacterium sp.]